MRGITGAFVGQGRMGQSQPQQLFIAEGVPQFLLEKSEGGHNAQRDSGSGSGAFVSSGPEPGSLSFSEWSATVPDVSSAAVAVAAVADVRASY